MDVGHTEAEIRQAPVEDLEEPVCVCEGPGLGTVRAEAGGFCSNSKFDRFLARKGDGRGFRRAAYHVKRPCGSHVPLDHAEVAPAIHAGQ